MNANHSNPAPQFGQANSSEASNLDDVVAHDRRIAYLLLALANIPNVTASPEGEPPLSPNNSDNELASFSPSTSTSETSRFIKFFRADHDLAPVDPTPLIRCSHSAKVSNLSSRSATADGPRSPAGFQTPKMTISRYGPTNESPNLSSQGTFHPTEILSPRSPKGSLQQRLGDWRDQPWDMLETTRMESSGAPLWVDNRKAARPLDTNGLEWRKKDQCEWNPPTTEAARRAPTRASEATSWRRLDTGPRETKKIWRSGFGP